MHINPRWIIFAKRLAASWFNIGFWCCQLVFHVGILVSLYRHRGEYAKGLLPELIHLPDDGLTFVAGWDVDHAMMVFFVLVLIFGVSVAVTPFVILACWRLRRDLGAVPASVG